MFIPSNEAELVSLFHQMCHELGFSILSIQSAYPDAVLYDKKEETSIVVEFEYNSNNFAKHRHDPRYANLVICWEKGDRNLPIPVLEISTRKIYSPNIEQLEKVEKDLALRQLMRAMLICKDFGIKVDYANVNEDLVLVVRNVNAKPLPNGKLAFQYVGA